MAKDFFELPEERFSYALDQECIEIYDDHFHNESHLICILTISQAQQLKRLIKEALDEQRKKGYL